jgi:hypothetical protein
MPESRFDQSRKSNEEVVNFLEHGDARGARWLDSHPEARERAKLYLMQLAESKSEPVPA